MKEWHITLNKKTEVSKKSLWLTISLHDLPINIMMYYFHFEFWVFKYHPFFKNIKKEVTSQFRLSPLLLPNLRGKLLRKFSKAIISILSLFEYIIKKCVVLHGNEPKNRDLNNYRLTTILKFILYIFLLTHTRKIICNEDTRIRIRTWIIYSQTDQMSNSRMYILCALRHGPSAPSKHFVM